MQEDEKAKVVELQKMAPWLYPVVFGAKHEELSPFLLKHLTPSATPSHPHGLPAKPLPLNLAGYAKAVYDRHAKLKLESLDPTGCYCRELDLWRVFIPQHVRECQEYLPRVLESPKEDLRRLREEGHIEGSKIDPEKIQELRRRYLEETPRNALELVNNPALPHMVILGDPGSGKSCLLQALTLRWAGQLELERQRQDLPLLIELRTYAQARERDHINGFLDFLQQSPLALCRLNPNRLGELLEAGRVQVFFDGLDEVFDPALREEIANTIQRFASDFPRTRIVVTSRVIGYKGESFRNAGFRHFMLQELDDEQVAVFLDKWHCDTYHSTETAERDEKQARLTRAVTDSRWEAMEALMRGWWCDPDTLPWLKARAQCDKYPNVRWMLVSAVALGWKDDLGTLPWLKARAESDENKYVRKAAVKLVPGWKDDSDTLPWIKARAESDEDMRMAVVEALAQGWKDDPETVAWLKAYAQPGA